MSVGTPAIRFDSHYVEAPFVGKGHEHILQFKVPVYGFKSRVSPVAPASTSRRLYSTTMT